MYEFFVEDFAYSLLFIVLGLSIKWYLKKTGVGDYKRVLSIIAFYFKFVANFLIIVGGFLMILLITLFFI